MDNRHGHAFRSDGAVFTTQTWRRGATRWRFHQARIMLPPTAPAWAARSTAGSSRSISRIRGGFQLTAQTPVVAGRHRNALGPQPEFDRRQLRLQHYLQRRRSAGNLHFRQAQPDDHRPGLFRECQLVTATSSRRGKTQVVTYRLASPASKWLSPTTVFITSTCVPIR